MDANGEPVSGQRMGEALDLSRTSIARAVANLRRIGYSIASSPHHGHRLVSRPDALLPFEVLDGLTTIWAGRDVRHYPEVPSTQTVARSLLQQDAIHGTLVTAGSQTKGRGRLGRQFVSPPGGIWCTLVLRRPLPLDRAPLTGLAAGVAVAKAIASEASLQPFLKWPNDVFVNGRKVAGVLLEVSGQEQGLDYALLGVGINANVSPGDFPAELQSIATSLVEEQGAPVDRRALLRRYLAELETLVDSLYAGDRSAVVEAWRHTPNMLGRRVRADEWRESVEGVAMDIEDSGALVVRLDGGTLATVVAGDVLVINPAAGEPSNAFGKDG